VARTFFWIAVLLARHRLGMDTERYAAEYRKENVPEATGCDNKSKYATI
jgi:hypothetical protein